MMKKVLVTGGSHAEFPMIQSLKKMGYFVITTGNNVDGIGHQYADQYIPGDFSDNEFVYELAKKECVDAIVSGCNDFAYLSTAYACEKLGLNGHDSYHNAMLIHHKDSFRKVVASLGIRTPKVISCETSQELKEAAEQIGFPLYVKPVDLTGGKGVCKCFNQMEVENAFEVAKSVSRQSTVIVEECIIGSNHGASVLLKAGKIVFCFVDNEQYYLNPYLVSGACYPSNLNETTIHNLCLDIEKIANELQLVDGLFHTQFIVEKNGTPVMIDPCRRAPGDLYISLVRYATEVDYPKAIVTAECGLPLDDQYLVNAHHIARECIMSDRNGTFKGLKYDSKIKKHIIDEMLWAVEGEEIENYMKYKAGIVFIECEKYDELYECADNFQELVQIVIG